MNIDISICLLNMFGMFFFCMFSPIFCFLQRIFGSGSGHDDVFTWCQGCVHLPSSGHFDIDLAFGRWPVISMQRAGLEVKTNMNGSDSGDTVLICV